MGTPLGPKYIPYTYMDPLGMGLPNVTRRTGGISLSSKRFRVWGFQVLRDYSY